MQKDATLNLPTNVLLATVRKYRDQLNERFERIKSGACDPYALPSSNEISLKPSGSGIRPLKIRPTKILTLQPYRQRINFEKIIVSHTKFDNLINIDSTDVCLSCNLCQYQRIQITIFLLLIH